MAFKFMVVQKYLLTFQRIVSTCERREIKNAAACRSINTSKKRKNSTDQTTFLTASHVNSSIILIIFSCFLNSVRASDPRTAPAWLTMIVPDDSECRKQLFRTADSPTNDLLSEEKKLQQHRRNFEYSSWRSKINQDHLRPVCLTVCTNYKWWQWLSVIFTKVMLTIICIRALEKDCANLHGEHLKFAKGENLNQNCTRYHEA